MKAQDEQDLARWVDAYVARKYARQLSPFFRATVTASTRVTTGAAPNQLTTGYLVSVKRTGETAADGNQYAVLGDYVPVIGDVVECAWRDGASGWVLGPLIPQRSKLWMRVSNNADQATGAGAITKVTYGVVDDDPDKDWNAANNQWVCRVPGRYLAVGTVALTSVAVVSRFLAMVYQNNAPVNTNDNSRQGNIAPAGAGNFVNLNVSAALKCQIGDVVDIRGYCAAAASTIKGTGGDGCSFAMFFTSGL